MIESLKKEFQVNWQIIRIGMNGPGKFAPCLSTEEVLEEAAILLKTAKPEIEAQIIDLLLLEPDDSQAIRRAVYDIAEREGKDERVEARKWRVFLLRSTLKNLKGEPLYKFLALQNFWEKFSFPKDMPALAVQGVYNKVDPTKYYTEENLKKVLNQHYDWLAKEKEAILSDSGTVER